VGARLLGSSEVAGTAAAEVSLAQHEHVIQARTIPTWGDGASRYSGRILRPTTPDALSHCILSETHVLIFVPLRSNCGGFIAQN
jgi:hypothetical protein